VRPTPKIGCMWLLGLFDLNFSIFKINLFLSTCEVRTVKVGKVICDGKWIEILRAISIINL
jgi:hypothetical protein